MLGVVWYLTDTAMEQGDPAGDGKHVAYLEPRQARQFRHCDPALYDTMGAIIEAGDRRVAAVRERNVLGTDTTYLESHLHTPTRTQHRDERLGAREAWVSAAVNAVVASDVVFVDPDKGILPLSGQPHRKDALSTPHSTS